MNKVLPFDDPISARELAAHLKRMRQLAGFTQQRAAERMGWKVRTLRLVEQGKGLTKPCAILALAESYGGTIVFKPPKQSPK